MTDALVFLARLYLAAVWIVAGVTGAVIVAAFGLWSTILNAFRRL